MPTGNIRTRVKLPLIVGGITLLLVLLALIVLAAFPVGLLRGWAERRLSDRFDAPVTLAAIDRDEAFSFTPTIRLRGLRIGQPGWAGDGDFLRLDSAAFKVPVLSLLRGEPAFRVIHVSGPSVALVRLADGRSNWSSQRGGHNDRAPGLTDLSIENSRFTLRDGKRRLSVAGSVVANARQGVVIDASGRFQEAPVTIHARGAPVVGRKADTAWSFAAELRSPTLRLGARGQMTRPLDPSDMALAMQAQAPTLKNLDAIIEAGLFGTQPIDLAASVRHQGRDWFIDRLSGSVGRSHLIGRASVLKRDERTKIDATIRASQFDFDDLADDAGLAEAARKRARVGARVIPDTRVNLSRMGPTDGVIRFRADRLLFKGDSAFRSLSGTLRLDHRDLRVENAVAGMASGRMTGGIRVDSRGSMPVLSTDLRFEGARLEQLAGSIRDVDGPLRGRIMLKGRGDTIRAALARADGRVAAVATDGAVKATIAYVLGQDLSGAIGQAIGDGKRRVPLRCLVADFRALNGVLTPGPLVIDTGVSVGRGSGRVMLDGETIALTISGATKGKGLLRITDPIRISGTLSDPQLTVAGLLPPEKPKARGVLKVLGRSIGSALGLRKTTPLAPAPATSTAAIDCRRLAAAALS